MKHPPSRAALMLRALELLRAGTLPSVLPGKLMEEFGLSLQPASEIAGAAVKRWKKETKPLGSESNEGQ